MNEFPEKIQKYINDNRDEFGTGGYSSQPSLFILTYENGILEFIPNYEEEKQWEETYYYFEDSFYYIGKDTELDEEDIKYIEISEEHPTVKEK